MTYITNALVAVLRQHIEVLSDAWKKDFDAVPGQDYSASLLRYFYENHDFYLLLYRSSLAWMLHENIKKACKVNAGALPVSAYAAAGALLDWIDEWIGSHKMFYRHSDVWPILHALFYFTGIYLSRYSSTASI